MSDLKLRIGGDASGAADALKSVAHEGNALHEVLEGGLKAALGSTIVAFTSWEAAGEKVVEMAKECVKEYLEAERAHRVLASAAGDLTKEFVEQAEAFERTLHVKAEDIEMMQQLLLRYGAAPETIGKAIHAALEFSAATGTDAQSALMQMVRGVEAGTGSLGRMGITFKATGDTAKDFEAAADALMRKMAGGGSGAAEAQAGGLVGATMAWDRAIENLHKSFGEFLALTESKMHVLATLSGYIEGSSGGPMNAGIGAGLALLDAVTGKKAPEIPTVHGEGEGHKGAELEFGNLELQASPEAIKKAQAALEEYTNSENKFYDARWLAMREDEKREAEHDQKNLESKHKSAEMEMELEQAKQKDLNELEDFQAKQRLDAEKQQLEDLTALNNAWAANQAHETQAWQNAGAKLGGAFADAMTAAMQGGQYAAEDAMLDLLASALTIAGGVIGGIAGEGNPAAIQAGQTIGSLAGRGIKAAATSGRKHHAGDWVERYHSGGWSPLAPDEVPAVLQTGERVLSRREVSSMGGRNGVDAAARGGGGSRIVVNVSAMDVVSTREFFEDNGGRGFYDALRTARGQLYPALRGG